MAPRRRRGATDSIPTGRHRSSASCTSSATPGDRLRRGPRSSTARSGDRRRSSPCCCRTRGRSASTPLTRCSSSPDGAPWIWQRSQRLIAALRLSPTPVLGLIDCYHAATQLSDAVTLRRWSAPQRPRWLNRPRGLLKRARVDEVITALRALCRGRTAGTIRTHLNDFLKNRHRFAYTTRGGARASAGQRCRRKRHPARHQSPHQGRIHLLATGERRRDSSPAVFL